MPQFFTRAVLAIALAVTAHGQDLKETPVSKPTLPSPYRLVPDWPTLPDSMKGPNGRKWGEVIRVHVAPNGNIWVFHRCFSDKPSGDATCLNRGDANPPILEFNPAGQLLKSFGVGLFAHPHGFTVDQEGNLWTTDTNDEDTIPPHGNNSVSQARYMSTSATTSSSARPTGTRLEEPALLRTIVPS